jgi:hypothetical protein
MIDAMYGANPSQQLQADPDFESRDQPAGDLGEVRVSPNTGGVVPAREDENVGIQGMLAAMQQQMSQMSNQMQTNKTEIAEQLQEQMQSVKIELKEIQLKQDVTTASLTSIDEIMTERRTSNTPDSISGLTGASAFTDALKVEIRATIIDSLREAYSEGGVVHDRCNKEDMDESVPQFGELIRDTVLAVMIPEIQETLVKAIQDSTRAMLKMIRSPEMTQAGEIAAIVKRGS